MVIDISDAPIPMLAILMLAIPMLAILMLAIPMLAILILASVLALLWRYRTCIGKAINARYQPIL